MRVSANGELHEFISRIEVESLALIDHEFLIVDAAENLYVGGDLESDTDAIESTLAFFKITPAGEVSELARFSPDQTPFDFQTLSAATVDLDGSLLVSGYVSDNIIRIETNGDVTVYLSGPVLPGNIPFDSPRDLLMDANGYLYIAASGSDNIIRVSPSGEFTELINGEYSFDGRPFGTPYSLSINQYGDLFISSIFTSGGAYLIGSDGQISKPITETGDGTGFVLDFGGGFNHSIAAFLGEALIGPRQTAVDSEGNFYLIGSATDNIFRITRDGNVATIVGTSKKTSPLIKNPQRIAIDQENTLYVTSWDTSNIVKIQNSLDGISNRSECSKETDIETITNTINCISVRTRNPVFRFYNSRDNAFFYTSNWDEANTIKLNSGPEITDDSRWPYDYQGSTFATARSYSGSVPLYRFYNYHTGHHFFTASEEERSYILGKIETGQWPFIYEDVAFQVYLEDPTPEFQGEELPVFRFYSLSLNRHFYTANPIEATLLQSSEQWNYEGVGFYGEVH